MKVDAARPKRPIRATTRVDGRGDLGLSHPELGAAGADGQSRQGLGRHVRVQPVQDVDPGGTRARRFRGERLCLLGRFDGDPEEWLAAGCGTRRRAEVGPGLTDPLEGRSIVRHAGARRLRPLAARDDVRTEPVRDDGRDHRGNVVGLDRVLPDDRIGERARDVRASVIQRLEIRDEDGRPVAGAGTPESTRELSQGGRTG